MQRTMKFSGTRWILTGLFVAFPVACSSGNEAEPDTAWPDLSDIQPDPALAERAGEPEGVIRALREEAERRKGEGYQAPEIAPETTPAPDPAPGGD